MAETIVNRDPSRRKFLQLSSTLLLATVLKPFSIFGRALPPLPLIERAAYTMGSIVTIKAYHTDERLCNLAIDEAFHEMKMIDSLMSVFNAHSQLSLVNREGRRKEIRVDSRILDVIEASRRFTTLTYGAFDPTIEPLMELYGFRDDKNVHRFPSDRMIADVLDSVGMEKVRIDRTQSTASLHNPQTELDFGGIAVGYALDQAIKILKSHGIESAIINHSGDIFAVGTPPDDDAWEIGITDPQRTDDIITTTRIKDQALSTSGNYENFIAADGKTIGHLLNPFTGQTATTMLSGTVVASTAIEADALSTGFFVLGLEKSRAIIRQSNSLQFVAVVQKNAEEQIINLKR
ncbi:MAG: FAD:protein FMN transferase [Ignavibacteriae bacterium]|nr:FAD:protein FMN transferase [Ignavibacteria bacterium]MBI3365117.1 FAD:protein FMN transferase [Ignavibacteriota bacterium]